MLDFLTHPFRHTIGKACKSSKPGKPSKPQTACFLLTGHILLGSSLVGASMVGVGMVGTSIIDPSLLGMGTWGIDVTTMGGGAAIALEIPTGDTPDTPASVRSAPVAPTFISQWNPSGSDGDNRVNDVDNGPDEWTIEDHSPEASDAIDTTINSDTVNSDTVNPTVSPLQTPDPPNPNIPIHLGTPPQALIDQLSQIDTAASNEDLETVMAFYSPNLQHSDGLTYEDLETMLTAFWKNHEALTYSTQIMEWEQTGEGFITKTVTTVTGQQALGTALVGFEATIESRQQMTGQMIVEQEILAEQSWIHLGEQPPTVRVSLPDQVAIGQPFYFDAIVMEPIGDSLLMGAAFSDTVSPDNYTLIPALELDVLGAGGLFKVGDAPLTPSNEWVSGLVIREDGMTGVTQRLQVVNLSDL